MKFNKPVAFDPVEIHLADHLAAKLTTHGLTVPVVLAVPGQRPPQFVRLVRVGGSQITAVTDRARIIAECWAATGAAAADLARLVRAEITAAAPGKVGPVWVERAVDVGLAFIPDPGTNLPRYLVTSELYTRGDELPA
ncbi:hypothetical protein GV792_04660 [Nocardia cyriacigeorgica]|uniref:hypothetical protein n=1 Tax=Nocardia cyriacigeorgica TaxID=135487 RepID=UPI0013BCFEDD|nr:hypothetical protein [Nocardia cyriacigeorgica]NEW49334.1 hypothetical protein [Nocardia cyriacigeorgica]